MGQRGLLVGIVTLVAVVHAGCSGDNGPSSPMDLGVDARASDGGVDARATDGGVDARFADGAALDGLPSTDGGAIDLGGADASLPDAGTDASAPDAGCTGASDCPTGQACNRATGACGSACGDAQHSACNGGCCDGTSCISGACVPAPPAGWTSIWVENGPATSCPSALSPMDLFRLGDLRADPASCSCGCGPAVGVACGTHMRCDPNAAQCSAAGNMNGQSMMCGTNIPNVTYPAFCRALPVTPFGGACVPSASGTPPAISWPAASRACGTTAGAATCTDASAVCVPALAGGIGPCIAQVGDHSCMAPYGTRTLYYDGASVTDTRACDGSGCSCAGPMGSSCDCGSAGCSVSLFSDGSCGTAQASVPANNTCGLVVTRPGSAEVVGATVVPGACPPGGTAQPSGSVTPTAPITVCCM